MRLISRIGCALLVLAGMVAAAGPTLVITDKGYQVMSVGSDGKAVLQDVGQVVDLRGSPGPTPGPGPNPPPTSDPITTQVKDWTAEVNDPVTAQGLALVYKTIGERSAGQPRANVMGALKQGTDDWLGVRAKSDAGVVAKWAPWRAKVSKLIDDEEAKAAINWPKFCAAVSTGIDQGAPGTAIPPELMTLLMSLLGMLIKWFFGGGFGDGTGI